MKRILVYGMTNNPGGIETYLLNTLKELKAKDIIFDFVTDFPCIAYSKQIIENGSKVYFIPAKRMGLLKHCMAMYKILKTHQEYYTVYFNLLNAGGLITALIPWILRRNIVVHSHNGGTEKLILHKLSRLLLMRIPNYYLACSKLAALYMYGQKRVSDGNVYIIPNSIDINKYRYAPDLRASLKKTWGLTKKFVICHIGRATKQKNPYRVIDIFNEVYRLDNSSILLYIGEGDMKLEIQEYAKKKEAANQIFFLGLRTDIPALMQVSDVFFLPSLYEGLPIVAIEAQAAGLPCILSENITKEVFITPNVIFIPLDCSDNTWANQILSVKNTKRYDVSKYLQDAGYDINNNTQKNEYLLKVLQ